MPLTEITIRALQPREKAFKVADSGGLHLLVTPSGGKLWRLKYRFQGKEKLLAFGSHPLVTLKAAREARDEAKRSLARGLDPSALKRQTHAPEPQCAEEEVVTFRDVAKEVMLKMQREGKSPATLSKNQWLIDQACDAFGDLAVRAIDSATILKALKRLEARGRHESARRLRSVIGGVFRYAIATARADSDPTLALQGALIRPVVRPRAAITEPKPFGALLRAIWGYDGQPEVQAALKLAALLAPRPGELRQAFWVEFNTEAALWTIPAERAKMRRAHPVPLGPDSLAILADLKAISRSELLFPSVRSADRPISENTMNGALRRLGYGTNEATAHGFRASFSTIANESGLWHPDAIERALGHVERNAVRAAYARGQHWQERLRLCEWWEQQVRELRDLKR